MSITSNSSFKLNDNNGYLFNNKNPQTSIKNNWHTTLLWDVYEKFDKNNDGNISTSEAKDMQKAFFNASKDNIFDRKEQEDFARKLGVTTESLTKAIIQFNGIALADEISSKFNKPFYKSFDKEGTKKLLAQINPQNISDVWSRYNEEHKDFFGNGKTTIADMIVKNYEKNNDTKNLLTNLFTQMYKAGKVKKIPCENLRNQFNEALKSNDFNKMKTIMNEMGERFQYAQRTENGNWIHANLDTNVPTGSVLDEEYSDELNQIKNYAINAGVGESKDLLGDGIIGNNPSKLTQQNNKQAKIILSALNELMKNPKYKEKIQSCYKKEDNQYTVYIPSSNTRICSTDREFLKYDKNLKEGVIGDGDTTAFIAAIIRNMELDKVDISDKEAMKKYIMNLFN